MQHMSPTREQPSCPRFPGFVESPGSERGGGREAGRARGAQPALNPEMATLLQQNIVFIMVINKNLSSIIAQLPLDILPKFYQHSQS